MMNRDKSYWNLVPERQPEWYVLQHEQIHFAIAEITARKLTEEAQQLARAYDEVNQEIDDELLYERPDQEATDRLLRDAGPDLERLHAKFDGDTSGTYDPDSLRQWVRRLESQMKELCGTEPHCQVRQGSRR